jgi:hypothetical protein
MVKTRETIGTATTGATTPATTTGGEHHGSLPNGKIQS